MDRAGVAGPLSLKERFAVGAVLGAMACTVLDAGMANVLLPGIARQFSVLPADAIIVVGAYQAALLAGLLPSAHLAGRAGHRRLFRVGILVFAASGLLAAAAPNLPLLAIARVIQGFGGAAVMALGIAVLRATLGDDRLPQVISWNALCVAVSAAAGPFAGAMMMTALPPQFIFAASLPLAVSSFLGASCLIDHGPICRSIDLTGIALHIAVVMAFLAGVRLAPESPLIAAANMAAAFLALAVQIRRSRTQAEPLLPSDLLRRRSFGLQAAASVNCFLAQSAGLIALSFTVQADPGRDPLTIGLLMVCWPLAVAVANLASGRLWAEATAPAQCAAGAMIMAIGLATVATADGGSATFVMASGAILCGTGFGLFQLANNRALFLGAPIGRSGAAGGLQGTARLAGQTLGTSLVALLFVATTIDTAPIAAAATGAGFALLAALFSLMAGPAASADFSPNAEQVAVAGERASSHFRWRNR